MFRFISICFRFDINVIGKNMKNESIPMTLLDILNRNNAFNHHKGVNLVPPPIFIHLDEGNYHVHCLLQGNHYDSRKKNLPGVKARNSFTADSFLWTKRRWRANFAYGMRQYMQHSFFVFTSEVGKNIFALSHP